MKKQYLVMFSGGLDSRLAVKIMQEKKFNLFLVFFKLPFSKNIEDEVKKFAKKNKLKLKIFDCAKGELLQEYLKIVREAKHGRGTGVNPCIDCKIFMLKKAKEFAESKNIEMVVTGEVLGQRPMSQKKKAMEIIENKSELKNRIIRPLVDLGILGRKRDKQINLAKKFKISYPNASGGCLLCEKELKKRLKYLLERGLDSEEIKLVSIGRHFLINNVWVVLGRDERENGIIENTGESTGELIVPDFIGPSALILDKSKFKIKDKVGELIKAYSKKGNCAPLGVYPKGTRPQNIECRGKERKKFEKYKL